MANQRLPDHYSLLKVSQTASRDEIKAAYLEAAKKSHPDKSAHADASSQKVATENFQRLNEAYETLIDPVKRGDYDARRSNVRTFSSSNFSSAPYRHAGNTASSSSNYSGSSAGAGGTPTAFNHRKAVFFFLKFSVIMSAIIFKFVKDVQETEKQWQKELTEKLAVESKKE